MMRSPSYRRSCIDAIANSLMSHVITGASIPTQCPGQDHVFPSTPAPLLPPYRNFYPTDPKHTLPVLADAQHPPYFPTSPYPRVDPGLSISLTRPVRHVQMFSATELHDDANRIDAPRSRCQLDTQLSPREKLGPRGI
ncbi:hypothetical protein M011DRAFT_329361 [Sporormia fimetaria CBS 119925]|uniref:Uncharacterized protein n=1 Tax=Sporormia fimetaria CBS 119925 TaxID=1340428 RepID=A0A6A6VJB3_9PLEO|nr:hypothetical protein M011DRAFT_329361 [Sporormia fimetaria CBS 119925]